MIGWAYFYQVALTQRWFENKAQTPFEAVFYTSFEELGYQVSLFNYANR